MIESTATSYKVKAFMFFPFLVLLFVCGVLPVLHTYHTTLRYYLSILLYVVVERMFYLYVVLLWAVL